MTHAETQGKDEKPVLRTVEEWAHIKGTKRWLLCLAAINEGWLPEQEDDACDEVTEEAFDAAVQTAEDAYRRCEADSTSIHGAEQRGTVRAICHPTHYVGVIVKRLPPTEANALAKAMDRAGRGKSDEEMGKLLVDQFKGVILWPPPAAVEKVRQRMVKAIEIVLPMRWMISLGADGGDRVKKR